MIDKYELDGYCVCMIILFIWLMVGCMQIYVLVDSLLGEGFVVVVLDLEDVYFGCLWVQVMICVV